MHTGVGKHKTRALESHGLHKRIALFKFRYRRKKVVLILALGALLGIGLFSQPRNALLGIFVSRPLEVYVYDARFNIPVSDTEVRINGTLYRTNEYGIVKTKVRAGNRQVEAANRLYASYKNSIRVEAFGDSNRYEIALYPLGRPTKIHVKNKINGIALSGVEVRLANGDMQTTNRSGEAVFALPWGTNSIRATISGQSIIPADVEVLPAYDSDTNTYNVLPSVYTYFLRKNGNTIDLMKARLDGTDAKAVMALTGSERLEDAILVTSSDGRYAALMQRRTTNATLYVFTTKDDSYKEIDVGAEFTLYGWRNDMLIYKKHKPLQLWENGRQELVSYDAAENVRMTLDQTRGEGTGVLDFAGETIEAVFITGPRIVVVKNWKASYYYGSRLADKQLVIRSILPDGGEPVLVQDWQAGYNTYIQSVATGPQSIYFFVELDGVRRSYWSYKAGVFSQVDDSVRLYFQRPEFPAFKTSPNGFMNVWYENATREVKLSDGAGTRERVIAKAVDWRPYGWLGDDYILYEQNSELYVGSRNGIEPGFIPLKIGPFIPMVLRSVTGEGYAAR